MELRTFIIAGIAILIEAVATVGCIAILIAALVTIGYAGISRALESQTQSATLPSTWEACQTDIDCTSVTHDRSTGTTVGWTYMQSEGELVWTVGYYAPDGEWIATIDYGSPEEAARMTHYLNGGSADNVPPGIPDSLDDTASIQKGDPK